MCVYVYVHARLQEYNICFTTVQRPADGTMPPLPESPGPGTPQAPLAHILASLVQQRRQVGLWGGVCVVGRLREHDCAQSKHQ